VNDALVLVVIVNWNGRETICSCLDSIHSQTYKDVRTVVVDNGSTDGSLDVIREEYSWASVIQNEENLGYCKALNQGINAGESEFVLCLNPDVELENDYIEKGVETLGRLPRYGMFTGKILRFDRKTLDSTGQFIGRDRRPKERGYGQPDRGQYETPEPVFSVCGAVAFYRRKMLDQAALNGQYFDEDFFAFNEDLDIGWRGQLLGWKCVYEPRAVAYHRRGGTAAPDRNRIPFGSRQISKRPARIRYHIMKNRYITVVKNDSLESFLADMLPILAFETGLWAFVLLTSPFILFRAPKMAREIIAAIPKRAAIQSRVVARQGTLRGGIA
jgi:GT2 family glycosyltransferase